MAFLLNGAWMTPAASRFIGSDLRIIVLLMRLGFRVVRWWVRACTDLWRGIVAHSQIAEGLTVRTVLAEHLY